MLYALYQVWSSIKFLIYGQLEILSKKWDPWPWIQSVKQHREQDGDMAWFCGYEACLSVRKRPGSPPQVALLNICPPPLGCLDTSTQPLSHHSALLRSRENWHGQPVRSPNPRQKVSPHLPEVTEVHQPGKNRLCIFKTAGPPFGKTHAHQARDGTKKMLSNGLCASQRFGERNPLNSLSSLCGHLWVSVPYSLPFFHTHMAGF